MTNTAGDLVKRLREHIEYELCHEAADEIDRLLSRVEELEAALRPLLNGAEAWTDSRDRDAHPIRICGAMTGDERTFTVGDLRRARSALSPQESEKAAGAIIFKEGE